MFTAYFNLLPNPVTLIRTVFCLFVFHFSYKLSIYIWVLASSTCCIKLLKKIIIVDL